MGIIPSIPGCQEICLQSRGKMISAKILLRLQSVVEYVSLWVTRVTVRYFNSYCIMFEERNYMDYILKLYVCFAYLGLSIIFS